MIGTEITIDKTAEGTIIGTEITTDLATTTETMIDAGRTIAAKKSQHVTLSVKSVDEP